MTSRADRREIPKQTSGPDSGRGQMANDATDGSTWQRLRRSIANSAGTIVFGMEDGTVSIFGLIFGVAATTTSTKAVLIAGASGAAAAAVSMMAGAYLDAETTRDEAAATRALRAGDATSLADRLAGSGLSAQQSQALVSAIRGSGDAEAGLLAALDGETKAPANPLEQALWMLLADFLAAAVPILPFVFLPVAQARVVSGTVTLALLVGLGVGRARIGRRSVIRTVAETVAIGVTAALAGIALGVLVDRLLS